MVQTPGLFVQVPSGLNPSSLFDWELVQERELKRRSAGLGHMSQFGKCPAISPTRGGEFSYRFVREKRQAFRRWHTYEVIAERIGRRLNAVRITRDP